MKILRKGAVSAEFRTNRPKLYGNCASPQNFYTRKLGETTVFYAVKLYQELPAYQRYIQNSDVDYFYKTLHLRCQIGF